MNVKLRMFTERDANSLYLLLQNEEINQFLDYKFNSEQDALEWIITILFLEGFGETICRAIVDQNNQLIGGVYLFNIDSEKKIAELGTWLIPAYWGKGVNAWAKKEILKIAFADLNLNTVLLFTDQNNIRSVKALEKLPYVIKDYNCLECSERKRKVEFQHGRNMLMFVVTKESFQQMQTDIMYN